MYCLLKEISVKWLIKLIEVHSHDLKEYSIVEVSRLA